MSEDPVLDLLLYSTCTVLNALKPGADLINACMRILCKLKAYCAKSESHLLFKNT